MLSVDRIRPFLGHTVQETDFTGLGTRSRGKVRDVYAEGDRVILISTDRQSAFDVEWCTIPLKGQALNQMSAWWFDRVKDVMPTHVIAVPDPNVLVARRLAMLKIEIVVRAYLTGSTSTSAWVNYEKGVRNFCGNLLPDGMRKNQRLTDIVFTPSTKPETGHDESLSPDELVARGVTSREEIERVRENAFALFRRGQEVARSRGLILVDTKYEMGYDSEGVLRVGDEVHTPDSSRYWIEETYEERFRRGQEPDALDKEFFRLWLRDRGFDPARPEETRPEVTDDARIALSRRYIELYERMTGEEFVIEEGDVHARMERNLERFRAGVEV